MFLVGLVLNARLHGRVSRRSGKHLYGYAGALPVTQLRWMSDPNLRTTGVRHHVLESQCQLMAVRFSQRLGVKPIAGVSCKNQ